MDWGSILGTTAAAASGGVFGLFGSAIGAGVKYFQSKQEHKQKIDLVRLQMEVDAQEGSWDGLSSSLSAEESTSNTYPWVNAIRGIYRPVLTTALLVAAVHVFNSIMAAIVGNGSELLQVFTSGELKDIVRYMIYSIIFTASTAATWWFGDRAFQPSFMKNL